MDARIIKTKKKIQETLLALLRSKKIHAISISEICKRAKINRNTFYSHYATPEAVLEEIVNDYLSEEYAVLDQYSSSMDIVVAACEYTKLHAEKILLMLENLAMKPFIEKAVDYSKRSSIYPIENKDGQFSPEDHKMIYTYIINGAVAIIKDWLYSGMKQSPQELGKCIDEVNSSLIKGINKSHLPR